MKRVIIQIDEDKCIGCGACIYTCRGAALDLVDGKAKLIKDCYCNASGDCVGICPVQALELVEKEAGEYDPKKTAEHLSKVRG